MKKIAFLALAVAFAVSGPIAASAAEVIIETGDWHRHHHHDHLISEEHFYRDHHHVLVTRRVFQRPDGSRFVTEQHDRI